MQRYLRLMLLPIFGTMILITLQGQEDSVILLEGKVIEYETGEALPFATLVLVKDTQQGVVTDIDGNFSWEVPANTRAEVDVKYLGFVSQRLTVGSIQENSTIALSSDVAPINPIIVRAKINYDELYSPTVQRLEQDALWGEDAINIARAFDGLPGVQIQQGALNTQRLSLRGIGARTPFATDQVRLYWNDIPLTNGAGESVLEDIESGFLEMAYVQTGPAPAALGANLGGSIQLVSKQWNLLNWATSFGVSAGDFGRNREWVNLHNRAGKWEQDLSVVRSASDGYRDNNDYERVSGTIIGRVSNYTNETLYLVHLRQLQAEIPSSLNANDFAEKPTAAAFNWASVNGREDQLTYLLGLQHTHEIGSLKGLGTLINRSSVFGGRRTNDEVRPFDIINEDSYQYGLRTNFIFRDAPALKGSFQVGGELFLENYDITTFQVLDGGAKGDELGSQNENRFYYFAFSQWTALWGNNWKTVVEGNLRQTLYSWQAVNLDREFNFDPVFLPSLSVFYQPADKRWSMHARVNRGISQPDPSSSIENSFLNGEPLSPATGWNREVGVKWYANDFYLEITAFQMDLEDALVQRQDEIGRVLFFNGGSARHQGIEFRLAKGWWLNDHFLHFKTNYTLADYRFRDFQELDGDYSGNDIPGVHPHRWRSDFSWKANRWGASLSLDVAAKQWVDDANTTSADGFSVVHTRLSHLFPRLGRGLKVYVGCNNIFDQAYAGMVQVNASGFGGNLPRYFYPALPRYFYLGVDYGL